MGGDILDWLSRLNEIKKKSGKTTDEIAELSGIPKGTLNKLFAGQTKDPRLDTVRAVVHCLGYTLDDLVPITDNKEVAPEQIESDMGETWKELINEFGPIPQNKLDLIIRVAQAIMESDI